MRKGCALGIIMLIVTVVSVAITWFVNENNRTTTESEDELVVVTSFYPVYVAAANVLEGSGNVRLENLTDNNGGCLHDYQITTEDMRKLSEADIFIINGAGMEGFMEEIAHSYPELDIVDTSEGIELMEAAVVHNHQDEEEHIHAEESEVQDEHVHAEESEVQDEYIHIEEYKHVHTESCELNGHIWMNPAKYRQQVANIALHMMEQDEENAVVYEQNAKLYEEKIQELEKKLNSLKDICKGQPAVIFHDAFSYLAEYLGMEVVYAIELEEDTSLSAGEVATIVDKVKESGVEILFSEEQFKGLIPDSVAKETDTRVCTIDTLVSGEMDKDAYLRGMEQNIAYLTEVIERHGN